MRCASFRLGRSCAQTTASPRAGACRLRRFGGRETGKWTPLPKKGFSRVWTLERVRAEPAVPPAGWLRELGGLMERRTACFRPPPGRAGKALPNGQNVPKPCFLPRHTMIRRAILSSAFAPQGQTASNTHPLSAPCPTGARQRRPTRRRRQAPAREPVAVCSHTRPKRNAPQPACPRRMGQTGVTPAPTALSAGTAGPPPQKPPQTTGSCS